jgi:NADPH:quinone reductase-like Zn-dependent oxidoreductase
VRRITNGRGVDHVLDVVGLATMRQSLDSIAYGGVVSVISLRSKASENETLDITMQAHIKACVVRGILGGSKQQLEEAVKFAENRGLSLPVDRTFGFSREEVIAALEYVASGKQVGKVCINLD